MLRGKRCAWQIIGFFLTPDWFEVYLTSVLRLVREIVEYLANQRFLHLLFIFNKQLIITPLPFVGSTCEMAESELQ